MMSRATRVPTGGGSVSRSVGVWERKSVGAWERKGEASESAGAPASSELQRFKTATPTRGKKHVKPCARDPTLTAPSLSRSSSQRVEELFNFQSVEGAAFFRRV